MSDFSDYFPAYRKALIRHLAEHALRTDGPFTLRSGEESDWYLDARQTTFDGAGAVLVGRLVNEALSASATAVGGMTMGSDPIALATAVVAALEDRALKAFSIRKEAKDHGVGGRIVGPLDVTDRVAVVEDTTTTGGALAEAIGVLRDAGIGVVQAIALVDRSSGVVAARMAQMDVPYLALVTPADLGVS